MKAAEPMSALRSGKSTSSSASAHPGAAVSIVGTPLLEPAMTGRETEAFLAGSAYTDIPAAVEAIADLSIPTRYAQPADYSP